MLLLKLGVTLIEALKYVVLLLHVALLFKEALEPLIRLLLSLLILLKWVTACNVNANKKEIRTDDKFVQVKMIDMKQNGS